jgi:hypothetical protein
MCLPSPGRCGARGRRSSGAARSRCARRRRGAHRGPIGRAREAPTAGGPCVRRTPGHHGGAEGTRRLDRRTWRAQSRTAPRRTAARGLGWSTSSARLRWQRRHGRRNEGRGRSGGAHGVASVHAVRARSASRRMIVLRPALVDNSSAPAIVAEGLLSRRIRSCPSIVAEGTFSVPHAGGIRKVLREARRGPLSLPHQVTDRTRDQKRAARVAWGSVSDPATERARARDGTRPRRNVHAPALAPGHAPATSSSV